MPLAAAGAEPPAGARTLDDEGRITPQHRGPDRDGVRTPENCVIEVMDAVR